MASSRLMPAMASLSTVLTPGKPAQGGMLPTGDPVLARRWHIHQHSGQVLAAAVIDAAWPTCKVDASHGSQLVHIVRVHGLCHRGGRGWHAGSAPLPAAVAAATSFIAAAAPTGIPLPAEPVHRLLVTATVLPLVSICGAAMPVVLCCCRAATAAAHGAAAALAHPVRVPLPVPVRALAPPACQGMWSATAKQNMATSNWGLPGAAVLQTRRQPSLCQVDALRRSRTPRLHAQLASPPGRIPVVVVPRAPVHIPLPPAAIFTLWADLSGHDAGSRGNAGKLAAKTGDLAPGVLCGCLKGFGVLSAAEGTAPGVGLSPGLDLAARAAPCQPLLVFCCSPAMEPAAPWPVLLMVACSFCSVWRRLSRSASKCFTYRWALRALGGAHAAMATETLPEAA